MMENQALLTALLPPPSEMEINQIKVEISGGSSEKIQIIETINPMNNVIQSNQELAANLNQEPKLKKTRGKNKKEKKSDNFVSSVMDQDNDNVIGFFENVDPMLAWALLKSRILPKVGNFDILAEKAKLKSESLEPVNVVKSVLDEVDALLHEVICMLQSCCQYADTSKDSVQLNAGLSLQLFGTNQAQVYVKNFDEFPAAYKEKMFKSPESKPIAHLVKTEMNIVNKIVNSATDDVVATSSNDEKIIEQNLEEQSDVLNELGFNEDDFNEAVEDDLDDPDEEILDDPNDEEDEDYQDPNNPNVNKTETNNTDDENKKQRSPLKKRAPKTCEKCHKTYNTQTQFRIHQRDAWRCPGKPEPKWLRINKGKDYYCLHPDCSSDGVNGPMFPRRNKYWHHLREKHWNREIFAFDCSYCQEKFPFYDMLRQHIKQYHEKAHVCKYCGSSFSRRRDLTLHERRHTGEKPYACDKCEFRCNTAGSLRMHTVRRHEDPTLYRTHVCEICGKSFHAAYILKEHILTHSDIKRYTCDICGRQLRNDSCYRRHMMNIHGQKISCDHCNKDFSSPIGVKIHKRDAHGIMY